MTSFLDSIGGLLNLYYIFPCLAALIPLYVQWRENVNRNLFLLIILTFSIFSMAVSIEYFIIYLFFDSLPGTINWRDKAIICVGAIAAFLVLLKIATEGTSVGMKISDILNSYFLPKPVPIPYSLHNELINKLHLSSAAIFSEDNNVVKFAFKDFVEHGSFLIVELERKYPTEDEKINMLRAKFEDSEDKFSNICSFNCSDDSRIDAVKSVSEFIGTVNGLLNSEN